ncbi:oxidoreductase [Rubrivirga sp. SAORIC476]|uniref:SDR family oxidoreductase n=1 Tax=Rubrivirga sp. SAORIC476 TaxID=1961794 RepID=UPI000BA99F25|nr:SDR family oxidoreductase [Rubrivirga sp. SAORIC476]PAP79583.1 oxidoreductase [Rubrivirga sp. SAORIC476]
MSLVLVTGASRGIGAAVAEAFAARGDRLALVARDADALAEVARRCAEAGGDARVFVCDVTDGAAVDALAASVRDWAGTPDVVVNNAGLFEPGGILETSPEAFRRQMEVNVVSAFLVTRAFLAAMRARGSGRILMMGSVASIRGYPGGAAYGAAKHALLGLARSVRQEMLGTGVSVTTLLPGATRTGSWDGTDLPDDRFMPPEDIARVAVEVATLSGRTVVEEVLLRPDAGDI